MQEVTLRGKHTRQSVHDKHRYSITVPRTTAHLGVLQAQKPY